MEPKETAISDIGASQSISTKTSSRSPFEPLEQNGAERAESLENVGHSGFFFWFEVKIVGFQMFLI